MQSRIVVQGAICLLTISLASSMVVSAFNPAAQPTLPIHFAEAPQPEPIEDSAVDRAK